MLLLLFWKICKVGLRGLDFEPLVNSFANLADSLEPFAEDVGNGLLWFFKNVLLPLGLIHY